MAYGFFPGDVVGALSGVAIAALGLLVVRIRPRRRTNITFGTFAILWGVQLLAANLSLMARDLASALVWARINVVLAIPLYYPLLLFVTSYPWSTTDQPMRRAALAIPGVVALVAFIVRPSLYIVGTRFNAAGLPSVVPGPLFGYFNAVAGVLVFVLALAIAWWRSRGLEITDPKRGPLALLSAALVLVVAHRIGLAAGELSFFAAAFIEGEGGLAFGFRIATVVSAAVVLALVAADAAVHPGLPWRRLILVSAALPVAFGYIEVLGITFGIQLGSTAGAWRLAMLGILTYAIFRQRIFDVDVHLRRILPVGGFAVASLIGLELLWDSTGSSLISDPMMAIMASLATELIALGVPLVGRMVLDRVQQNRPPDYARQRKLEVYRAALRDAYRNLDIDEREQAFLADLRKTLAISSKDHERTWAEIIGSPAPGAMPAMAG